MSRFTKPTPKLIHAICWLVEDHKEIGAKLRGLELPLRTDARNRFRKKQSLLRVTYVVYRVDKKELVKFYELGRGYRVPALDCEVTAWLSFKAIRTPARHAKAALSVMRDRSWTTKRIRKDA